MYRKPTIQKMSSVNGRFILKDYNKPRDFVKSPFRYPGGKFYALKYLIPFLDCVPHDEFREPFVGGGNIFFGKKKTTWNWINDLDTDLIDIYLALTDDTLVVNLGEMLSHETATKERHNEVRQSQPQSIKDKVFKTYYLNRTSYCGIIHKPAWGYKEGKSSPPKNWSSFLISASPKLSDVKITSLDFEEVISTPAFGSSTLLYLDPPYYWADQKRAYTKSFQLADHQRLCNALKKTDFYFCLSYDDCPEIRNLYKWANIFATGWLYNTANKKGVERRMGNELIITNYEIKTETLLL